MKKVLVANRGEIACRIINTLKKRGITSVAVYSEADKDSLAVKLADESVCIGKAKAKESYLNISRVIAACEYANVDAVHPGYGFLSEHAIFAQIVEQSGYKFIGPNASMIEKLGDKIYAKKIAKKVGCPIIEGSVGEMCSLEKGLSEAAKIGYPVCIKASAGGGGKGIRIAYSESEFKKQFLDAKGEAKTLLGNDKVYLEKFIVEPRHLEVQLVSDEFGNCLHLYERDCSIQRKRQKLIEEGGEIVVPRNVRQKIYEYAKKIVQEVHYCSLATVEFLVDRDNNFYFMEVNTRIQVEHCVTEQLTGLDLVSLQLDIAMGKPLDVSQSDISSNDHAIEFRINAEDHSKNFMPSLGVIEDYEEVKSSWCRTDGYVFSGYSIKPYYDSLIAKVIVTGKDRKEAIEHAKIALKNYTIEGIVTTIDFYLSILEDDVFVKNNHHITYLEHREKEVLV